MYFVAYPYPYVPTSKNRHAYPAKLWTAHASSHAANVESFPMTTELPLVLLSETITQNACSFTVNVDGYLKLIQSVEDE